MTKRNTAKKQMGFFDLGISLGILALFGAFAYAATPDQNGMVAVEEAKIEVVSKLEPGNANVSLYE